MGDLLLGGVVELEQKSNQFLKLDGIMNKVEDSVKEHIIPDLAKRLGSTAMGTSMGNFTDKDSFSQFLNIEKICDKIYTKAIKELSFENLRLLDMASSNMISSQFINGGVYTLKFYDSWNNSYKDQTLYIKTDQNGRTPGRNETPVEEWDFTMFSVGGSEHSISHAILQSLVLTDQKYFDIWKPSQFSWQHYAPSSTIEKFIRTFKNEFLKWWPEFETNVLNHRETKRHIDKLLGTLKYLHDLVPEYRDVWLPVSEQLISEKYDARALYNHWRTYAEYLPALWPTGIKRWMTAKSLHEWVNDKMLENLREFCAEDGEIWMPIVLRR